MALMRLRALALLLTTLLAPALQARAECAGQDLIATLPADDRAALDSATSTVPYPEGNHWLARRGATEIGVIGTYHLYDARMAGLTERLAPVIEGAEALFVEATEAEVARLQSEIARDPSRLFLTTGPTLPEALAEPEWNRLKAEFAARGIPPFMGAKFQPWYVSVLLAIPACLTEGGQEPRKGLDHLLMQRAAGAGVPTHALEPWDTALGLFDALPFDKQIDMLRASLPLASQAEDSLATLEEAYFRQEHRLIWEYSRLVALTAPEADTDEVAADFALMEEALLTARNRAWIDRLLPEAEGRRVVMAVGAAHLSGPAGVLQLLKDRGFALERRPF